MPALLYRLARHEEEPAEERLTEAEAAPQNA
jgi:hypothetical protein